MITNTIKKTFKKFFIFLSALIILFIPNYSQVFAKSATGHYTVIINQVRGTECCDVGTTDNLQFQLQQLSQLKLPATFTLRYDVINDSKFVSILQNLDEHSTNIELGAFLEITPRLAKDAQVKYQGNENSWFEAQNAYLIGYSQEDRQKIIDTYMASFNNTFGYYPQTSTAWMIDNWSLAYLKKKYSIKVHQLTREQFGTDSYNLYGGPPHYPYWPSDNWAMIPSNSQPSINMPLIIRQTITDPVLNYGDSTSAFTSQPNDYLLSDKDINYFKFLFDQAHQQPQEFTFTLVGLENSMDYENQKEFAEQLKYIKNWENQVDNQVITSQDLSQILTYSPLSDLTIYTGHQQDNDQEKAWWITTPNYRARMRLSDKQLFISDLRVYNRQFLDPYFDSKSRAYGWWVTPFLLDGSRFFYQDSSQTVDILANDSLINRKSELPPTRLLLKEKIVEPLVVATDENQITFSINNQVIATFTPEKMILENFTSQTDNSNTDAVIKNLSWIDDKNNTLWSFDQKPFVAGDQDLTQTRKDYSFLLFPELKNQDMSVSNSYLYLNNTHAIAGNNPVRLVFFPRDKNNQPILITKDPTLTTNPKIQKTSSKRQHGQNGMIFLDFINDTPLATTATIDYQNFQEQVKIYFAPNCRQQPLYCLAHPIQAWWYIKHKIQTISGD